MTSVPHQPERVPAALTASTLFMALVRTAAAATTANPKASAAAGHAFAAPNLASVQNPSMLDGLGQVTLALGAVLVTIFAVAWLLRRVRAVAGRADALAVLAEVRVGPKERAVLLKVGRSQLLVGVASGQVNTLHVLTDPIDLNAGRTPAPERPSFRALLARSLGK